MKSMKLKTEVDPDLNDHSCDNVLRLLNLCELNLMYSLEKSKI